MRMSDIPFGTTDWAAITPTEHAGERGNAYWRTREFGGIRVRMVEYTPGYLADHWCEKGHVLLCLEGELLTELADGRTFTIAEQASLARSADRVASPPALPHALPLVRPPIFHLDRRWWKTGLAKGSPSRVRRIPGRQTFFVQQGIPLVHEPLDEGQEVPVGVVDSFAFFLVGAEILALYPDLESSPGESDIGIDAVSIVRVGRERHLHGELAGVAGQLLPSNRHRVQLQWLRMSRRLTWRLRSHLRRMYSGTSQRPWCPTWRRTRTQSEGFGARKAHRKLGYHRVGAKSA